MRSKRFLILMLLVMILSGLTGNISGQTDQVTLVFSDWHLTEAHWEATLLEAFELFEQEHPNINIVLDYVPYGEKETKYATEIEAGVGPDVLHLHAYSLRSFIDRGYLLDVTSFIQQEGSGFLDAWYPQTLELMQVDGRYYALPGDFMAMVLFYNQQLFEEAGLPADTSLVTWDDFLVAAEQLTRDRDNDGESDTWGFGAIGAVDPGFELRFSPVLFSNGGNYLTEDGRCSALNTVEAQEAFTFFINLYADNGVVPHGVVSQTPGTVRQLMANEEVAMILGSGWTPPIIDSNNPDLNALEVLRAAPVPTREGFEPATTAWLSAWVINPNTDHPKESWELMKFLTSQAMEQRWFDDARVLSSRQDVSGEYAPLLEDPFANIIAAELPNARFVPQVREWPEIIEVVNTAAQEAFAGFQSPEAALEDAHNLINDLLIMYREPGEVCPEF